MDGIAPKFDLEMAVSKGVKPAPVDAEALKSGSFAELVMAAGVGQVGCADTSKILMNSLTVKVTNSVREMSKQSVAGERPSVSGSTQISKGANIQNSPVTKRNVVMPDTQQVVGTVTTKAVASTTKDRLQEDSSTREGSTFDKCVSYVDESAVAETKNDDVEKQSAHNTHSPVSVVERSAKGMLRTQISLQAFEFVGKKGLKLTSGERAQGLTRIHASVAAVASPHAVVSLGIDVENVVLSPQDVEKISTLLITKKDTVLDAASVARAGESVSKLVVTNGMADEISAKDATTDQDLDLATPRVVGQMLGQTAEDAAVVTQPQHGCVVIGNTSHLGPSAGSIHALGPPPTLQRAVASAFVTPATSVQKLAVPSNAYQIRSYEASTPNRLEVGLSGGALGWLNVRAEMSGDGSVHALLRGSVDAASVLRTHTAEMSDYLKEHAVPVSQIAVEAAQVATSFSTDRSAGGSMSDAQGQRGRHDVDRTEAAGGQRVRQDDEVATLVSVPLGVIAQSGIALATTGGWLSVRV